MLKPNKKNKVYVTQQQIDSMIIELTANIQHYGCKFDCVVAIQNGGSHIGPQIADILNLPYREVQISCYDGEVKRDTPLINLYDLPSNLSYLIVDDIVDSGQTMKLYNEIIGIKESDRVAVLFLKTTSSFTPDFFVQYTNDWIVFPWEIENDTNNS